MTVDVVNSENKKVGSVELSDAVFGGRVKTDLIHASVVRTNAAERRGTHATKTRANVSGSGKKPWRQKGTGRARVGEIRNPLWRKGGTVFGPQPRSYAFTAPKKVELAGLGAALAQKAQDGDLVIVDALAMSEVKTRAAVALLTAIGVAGQGAAGRRPARRAAGAVGAQPGRGQLPRQLAHHRPRRHRHDQGRGHQVGDREAAVGARRARRDEMKITEVIRRPLVTEKTTVMKEDGRTLVFEVARGANKVDVKRAVEKLFGPKVASVRTAIAHGKEKRQGKFVGRRSDWKKAYVVLKKGETLPEFADNA